MLKHEADLVFFFITLYTSFLLGKILCTQCAIDDIVLLSSEKSMISTVLE